MSLGVVPAESEWSAPFPYGNCACAAVAVIAAASAATATKIASFPRRPSIPERGLPTEAPFQTRCALGKLSARQAVALAQGSDRLHVHRQLVSRLDRRYLLEVRLAAGEMGRELLEVALEAAGRDQLEQPRLVVAGIPERVRNPAWLEHQLALSRFARLL